MENNQTIIELYNIYLELGHEVFEEKFKIYLHNNHVCGSTNSLNTFIASAKENLKLGEVFLFNLFGCEFLLVYFQFYIYLKHTNIIKWKTTKQS